MANILRGYGLAREQGYFKQEQEADVQRHRQRLIKQGKLEEEQPKGEERQGGGAQQGGAQQGQPGFEASQHAYEVLPEVLQQQARLDDPHALRRKQYDRRVKGEPAPISDLDLLRARSKVYVLGAAVGHVPRMSMGRARWEVPVAEGGGDGGMVAGVRQLTPEAREVASRTYVAGVRALVFGSLLGALGLAAAITYGVQSWDIRSGEDLGERMRQGLAPLSSAARSWLLPLKERAHAWLGPAGEAPAPGLAAAAHGDGGGSLEADGAQPKAGPTSEFSRRLSKRYNPRKAGEASGEGAAGSGELA